MIRSRDLPFEHQDAIRSCLRFVLESGELEGEFETRMGVTPHEVQSILDRWPEVEDTADGSPAVIAINNALNEVCHGVSVRDWSRWFAMPREDVEATYAAWARGRGRYPAGIE
jgi:hypothetical protein